MGRAPGVSGAGGELRLLRVALQHHSAFAFGPVERADPRSLRHLPAVGLAIGGFGALALWVAAHLWPATVAVGVAVAATAWAGRALSERALLQAFDPGARGLDAGSGSPSNAAAGIVALVFVLMLEALAIHGLARSDLALAWAAMPLAGLLSRALAVSLAHRLAAGDATMRSGPRAAAARLSEGSLLAVALWCAGGVLAALVVGISPSRVLATLVVLAGLGAALDQAGRRSAAEADRAVALAQPLGELATYLVLLAVEWP
jgi:adenosylcobinamide-GDP ribazoletransferase